MKRQLEKIAVIGETGKRTYLFNFIDVLRTDVGQGENVRAPAAHRPANGGQVIITRSTGQIRSR
jgi:hypothetical protein